MIENQILCGDCAEVMAGFPEGCIHLVLSSPPYGDLRRFHGFTLNMPEIAHQLYRVSVPGGILVWVRYDQTLNGDEANESFDQVAEFRRAGFSLSDTMIWAKPDFPPQAASPRYYQAFEYMFVFCKGRTPRVFNPITVPSKTAGTIKRSTGLRSKNGDYGEKKARQVQPRTRLGNVWTISPNKRDTGHPAVFPTKLAQMHIYSWSNPGDLVLDPFVGSGTTCATAKAMGRRYLGIDVSEEYCNLSRKWLDSVEVERGKPPG